jgi:hypothetical protein
VERTVGPRTRSWCLFTTRGRPWAIDLDAVVEVVDGADLVRVPLGPPQVIGLFAFRREVVPVVDLFATAGGGDPPTSAILMVHTDRGLWGLRIDRQGVSVAEGPCAGDRTMTRGETVYTVIDPEHTCREVRSAVESTYNS